MIFIKNAQPLCGTLRFSVFMHVRLEMHTTYMSAYDTLDKGLVATRYRSPLAEPVSTPSQVQVRGLANTGKDGVTCAGLGRPGSWSRAPVPALHPAKPWTPGFLKG